jgi:hypothetical protein
MDQFTARSEPLWLELEDVDELLVPLEVAGEAKDDAAQGGTGGDRASEKG